MKEYVTSIGARKKWHERERNVNKGEIVLVTDTDMPRRQWTMGALWRPIQEQMDLLESLMSRLLTVHTEDQFRGFLRLNSKTKEDFGIEIPTENPGGGKC